MIGVIVDPESQIRGHRTQPDQQLSMASQESLANHPHRLVQHRLRLKPHL